MTNMDASSKNIVTAVFIGAYMLLLIVLRPFCSLKIMVRFVAVAASRGGSNRVCASVTLCACFRACVFVCACKCVRMCACVRGYVRVCVCACVRVCVYVFLSVPETLRGLP